MSISSKHFHVLILLWLIGCAAGCISRFALTRISVVDEESGDPINQATIGGAYRRINFDVSGKHGHSDNLFRNKNTGQDNVKWVFGWGNKATVSAWLDQTPEGYYRGSGDSADFWGISYFLPIPIWLPPIRNLEVKAIRKQNPVHLIKHHLNDHYLKWNKRNQGTNNISETYAYDCFIGDWCPPHGQGKSKDMIFTYAYEYYGKGLNGRGEEMAFYKKERTLSFSNPGDGLIIYKRNNGDFNNRPSDLTAPKTGYIPNHSSYYGKNKDSDWEVSGDTHINFYFRIRTKFNSEGEVIEGHYGKLSGRYSFYLGLYSDFVLNPASLDANLEY